MPRSARVLVVLVLLLAVVSMSAFAQQKSATPAYLLGILLGFGTGHFYLQDSMAVPFLVMEGSATAGIIVGYIIYAAAASSWITSGLTGLYTGTTVSGPPAGLYIGGGLAIIGGLALTGFKIWEIIDLFGVVKEQREQGKIAFAPAVTVTPGGQLATGVSFRLSY